MQTNGFALFKGEGAARRAQDAAASVKRYAKEVIVGDEGDVFNPGSARPSGKAGVVLAYSLGGSGFPLVHGFASGDGAIPEGEFSLLGEGASGPYGARDLLGTRGLWVTKEGAGTGSLASDFRLISGRAVLLPPGSVYANRRVKRLVRERQERPAPRSFAGAAAELASLIEGSVKRRVQGHGRVAVSFSGGLDSSLLALVASRHAEVVLCSAYSPGSRDERQSDTAAGLLGLRLETALLDEESLVRRSGEAELPPGEATVMDRALWCIYAATSELARASNAGMILLGQLADELFGGYMKYSLKEREEGAQAAQRMMDHDVRACADRGFLRDEAACSASCEVRFPYADEAIASFAASLPLGYKIREGQRKAVLRAAALELGLPEELAEAPKKAAQFSSGAAKLLEKQ